MSGTEKRQLNDNKLDMVLGGVMPSGSSDDWLPWDRDKILYCPNCEGHDLRYQIRDRKYRLHCNACDHVFWESQSKGCTVSGSF